MDQITQIMQNTKNNENSNSAQFFPFIFSEYIPDNIISEPFQSPFNISNNNKINENILLPLENIKNIFKEDSLDLNESDEEEENQKSLYFIKRQENLDTESRSTENSTNIITLREKNNENKKETTNQKKNKFQTFLKKKRGKKPKPENLNPNKKSHGSLDFDNIQRKIQVHYFNFLISFANDMVLHFFGKKNKYQFKDVKYELKRIVNHKNVEYLKSRKYSDIIQMKISPKNKKFKEDTNKNIFLQITQLSKELKNFFDINYLYIFQKYYFELKPNEKEINFEGKIIPLSLKTKGFYHLLEKNKFSKKFNDIINDVYFTDTNYLSDKKFMITNSLNSKKIYFIQIFLGFIIINLILIILIIIIYSIFQLLIFTIINKLNFFFY